MLPFQAVVGDERVVIHGTPRGQQAPTQRRVSSSPSPWQPAHRLVLIRIGWGSTYPRPTVACAGRPNAGKDPSAAGPRCWRRTQGSVPGPSVEPGCWASRVWTSTTSSPRSVSATRTPTSSLLSVTSTARSESGPRHARRVHQWEGLQGFWVRLSAPSGELPCMTEPVRLEEAC